MKIRVNVVGEFRDIDSESHDFNYATICHCFFVSDFDLTFVSFSVGSTDGSS